MPENNKRTAEEELSLVMRWKLRKDKQGNAELIASLGWLGSNEAEKNQRVEDFEFVNQRLNELMQSPENISPQYKDVALLARALKGKKIPTLEAARKDFYAPNDMAGVITSTIEKAVKDYPSWAKINPEYPSRGTPASGALIEGFGAFVATSTLGLDGNPNEKSQINQYYVRAFEEVLLTEKSSSLLVGDVIGWMNEEITLFPRDLQPKISELSENLKSKP